MGVEPEDGVGAKLAELDARLARLEGTVKQMNKRLGRVEDEVSALRKEMTGLRRDMRYWALFITVTLGAFITAFTLFLT